MSLLKHKNPTDPRRVASAPYNFIPLPEKVALAEATLPPHDSYDPGRYTGSVECKLTTASPLYIRCGESPEEFNKEHKKQSPEFFTDPVTGQPIIPGSNLRGMLRAMVEIVSYSKVLPVSNERLIYRVIGDTTSFGTTYRDRLMKQEGDQRQLTPLLQAGYIEKHGLDWVIRPAQTINGTTFARILIDKVPHDLPDWHHRKNARKIWVKLGPYGYKNVRGGFIKMKFTDVLETSSTPKANFLEAVHVRSGRMNSKKFDRVIYPIDEAAPSIPIPDDMVVAYREQVSKEQEQILGSKEGVLQDKQPVFYLVENGELIFFGHTMMLRLPYPKRPRDFVPPKLRDETQIDFTEAIFGYVGLEVKDKSRAGRVYFSDALLAPNQSDPFLAPQPITPKILSGPKPTTIQHYLTQQTPDAKVVGQTKDGQPKTQVFLSHYASPTPHETVIRGHKLYWHKPGQWQDKQAARDFIEDVDFLGKPAEKREKDTQHTHIKPLRAGVVFDFTIHFENLSLVELGALLWSLYLGADPQYRLKLGMGKPLGMGAVKTEAALHLTNRQQRYARLFDGDGWRLGLQDHDTAAVAAQARQEFEKFILSNDADAFGGEGRLTQLKALLSWPGPDLAKTRYMQIEPENEYKNRKVLPTPTYVLNGPPPGDQRQRVTLPAPTRGQPRSVSAQPPRPSVGQRAERPAQAAPAIQPAASPPAQSQATPRPATKPASPITKLPEVGEVFTGMVDSIKPDGTVVIRYKDRPVKEVRALISAANLAGKQYPIGNPARCEVIAKHEQFGAWILECKPGQKKEKGK